MEGLDLQRIEETVSYSSRYILLIVVNGDYTKTPKSTVLVFQIINILVDLPANVSYFAVWGFAFVPLPCPGPMWNVVDLEGWTAAFKQWYGKRTVYGLSEAGALTRIIKTPAGLLETSIAEWEGWVAELGDIGTLLMIVAPLL